MAFGFTMTRSACAAAILAIGLSTAAKADGPGKASLKDAPVDEGRKFSYSWNIGATSDYIFRGVSQNGRHWTPQGGVDITYGIAYAGIWASGVDFGQNPLPNGKAIAGTEVDFYAGIKPVVGPVTFDLGVIYYAYPSANDHGPKVGQVREQDYVEGKLGASGTFIPNLTTGLTVFLSPQYIGGQGFVTTVEGTAAYELPKLGKIVPTVGGTLGSSFGDAKDAKDPFVTANGKDSYIYWNAGLTLGFDKLALDFRYWDTNIPNNGPLANGFCNGNVGSGHIFQCDGRFVASAKVTF